MRGPGEQGKRSTRREEGFSLLEMLVSVAIITVLMAVVFQFLDINQRRYRSQQLLATVTEGGRSTFEVLTQELHQAGYNPPFQANKYVGSSPPSASGALISLPVSASLGTPYTQRIYYGSRLVVGNACPGPSTAQVCNQEEVVVNQDVTYISSGASSSTYSISSSNVPVVLTYSHSAGEPVYTRNYPYPNGVLYDNRTTILSATIASISLSSNIVTVITSGPHGFLPSSTVSIQGVANTAFNGTFTILTIPTTTSFTYALTGANATSSGGAATEIGPLQAVADNKIRFFGDLQNTGDMWYAEYRLRYWNTTLSTPAWSDACDGSTAGSTGPFTLTRFVNKLAKGGVFYVPANATEAATVDNYAGESPLANNIQGTCSSAAAGATVYTAPDGTTATAAVADGCWLGTAVTTSGATATCTSSSGYVTPLLNPDGTPVIWTKMNTYGYCYTGTTPCTPFYQNFVTDIQVTLTVQESQRDIEVGAYGPGGAGTAPIRTQRLQTHIVPRNINDALALAANGAAAVLPGIPIDVSHDCNAATPKQCPSLPFYTLR